MKTKIIKRFYCPRCGNKIKIYKIITNNATEWFYYCPCIADYEKNDDCDYEFYIENGILDTI